MKKIGNLLFWAQHPPHGWESTRSGGGQQSPASRRSSRAGSPAQPPSSRYHSPTQQPSHSRHHSPTQQPSSRRHSPATAAEAARHSPAQQPRSRRHSPSTAAEPGDTRHGAVAHPRHGVPTQPRIVLPGGSSLSPGRYCSSSGTSREQRRLSDEGSASCQKTGK